MTAAPAGSTDTAAAAPTTDDELSVVPDRTLASSAAAGVVVDVEAPPKTGEDADDAEVQPQRVRPRAAPVQKTKPTRRLQQGDLVCGLCGEGNAPSRKFCSRCGAELASAEVVRAPWWRRLMIWRRKPRKMAAGTRPGQAGARPKVGVQARRAYRKVRNVVGALLLVIGLAVLFVPPLRSVAGGVLTNPVGAVKQRVNKVLHPKYVPARPAETVASAEVPEHGARLAVDQFNNTYWSAPWDQQQFPRLTFTFDKAVTIDRLIVTPGAGDDFAANHRPSVLHLVYSNNQSDDIRPVDGAKPQTFELKNAKDVTRIEIGITDIFRAQDAPNVAIAELEFFVKE